MNKILKLFFFKLTRNKTVLFDIAQFVRIQRADSDQAKLSPMLGGWGSIPGWGMFMIRPANHSVNRHGGLVAKASAS